MSPLSAERETQRVCRESEPAHVTLLAWLDGNVAGVASYELAQDNTAEVAFAVPDALHGSPPCYSTTWSR